MSLRPLLAACALAGLLAPLAASPAAAQFGTAPQLQISWEVRNRFRLFREERDFLLHLESTRDRSILAAEQALGVQSDGRGWARNIVNRLCIDLAGRVNEPCTRDNVKESYLTPIDHPITVRLTGPVPVGATCAWSFDDGDGPQTSTFDCAEPVNLRVRYGRETVARVDVTSPEGTRQVSTGIQVRDVLIAGLGDSIASGEGNPDRPIALADEGFCFRSYLGGPTAQYYRPSRAGFKGGRACEAPDTLQNWQKHSAVWLNAACHRSLYSYQTRTALALAVRYPHVAVTYLPLACTGATIADGLFGSQRARECLPGRSQTTCAGGVNGQLGELREALTAAQRRQPDRRLDLVLLSIGANDINFSGLVADVIVDTATERTLFKRSGVIGSVDESRGELARDLPRGFAKLRDALKPLVGDLSHVIYTSYGNPALSGPGTPCPGGPAGFEVHPSFNANPQRLANVAGFVENEFLPALRGLAQCTAGVLCRDPRTERMTFVDAHQPAFAQHGFCARSPQDPPFDRECFAANGESFDANIVSAANEPLLCGRGASEYRPYLPRARWIRDANDSYFSAMTYPQGLPAAMQPADIHDASWGVLSAVYGGAVHPTAEGHAAMADAAFPAAAEVLNLDAAEPSISSQPLPPAGGVQQ
ncbi:putative Esterase, SGNH hydrolase-type [Bradyrhizobium sp. ORS 285]|nr:putative Esterase, SGNH hydrolase-type [Bradyrhizobium sp. ORS 285]